MPSLTSSQSLGEFITQGMGEGSKDLTGIASRAGVLRVLGVLNRLENSSRISNRFKTTSNNPTTPVPHPAESTINQNRQKSVLGPIRFQSAQTVFSSRKAFIQKLPRSFLEGIKHMSTTALLNGHIKKLGPNKRFSTQEILHIGTRGSIDMYLSRKVKSGALIRLARGVFTAASSKELDIPSLREIAEMKARAFSKVIIPHGETIARALKLLPPHPDSKGIIDPRTLDPEKSFIDQIRDIRRKAGTNLLPTIKMYTDGAASNFISHLHNVRIKFIKISDKKMRSFSQGSGYWINAIRTMGKIYFEKHTLQCLQQLPTRKEDREDLQRAQYLTPKWLYKVLDDLDPPNPKTQFLAPPATSERLEPLPRQYLDAIYPDFKQPDRPDFDLFF